MLQRAVSASGGGGGQSFVETYASISAGQSIALGFYPDQVSVSFDSEVYFCFWNKDIKSGKVLQLYGAQVTWYDMPNNYYMGIANIDSNGNISFTYAATNVRICAYKA